MSIPQVSIRDLRNRGGDVVDRVERGEHVIITRDGRPVAELHPLAKAPLSLESLLERWRRLPIVDPVQLRADIDDVLDSSL
jgi:prevent-host-death family protein